MMGENIQDLKGYIENCLWIHKLAPRKFVLLFGDKFICLVKSERKAFWIRDVIQSNEKFIKQIEKSKVWGN